MVRHAKTMRSPKGKWNRRQLAHSALKALQNKARGFSRGFGINNKSHAESVLEPAPANTQLAKNVHRQLVQLTR